MAAAHGDRLLRGNTAALLLSPDALRRGKEDLLSAAESAKQAAKGVPLKYVALIVLIAWLHGATTGVALHGEEGMMNVIFWRLVMLLPGIVMFEWEQWRRIAAAFMWFAVCSWVMCIGNAFAWYRHPRDMQPLPDLLHIALGPWKDLHIFWPGSDDPPQVLFHMGARDVPDVILAVLVVSTLTLMYRHACGRLILVRYFAIYGALMLVRALTVSVTSYPDSLPECHNMTPPGTAPGGGASVEELSPWTVLLMSMKMVLPGAYPTCGDMIFSGHSIVFVECAMTFHTYYKWVPDSVNWVKCVVWLVASFGLLSIIWVRMHYTVDVLLAIYLTVSVWLSYHRVAVDIAIGHRFHSLYLIDGALIYPAVEWLETGQYERKDETTMLETGVYRRAHYRSPIPTRPGDGRVGEGSGQGHGRGKGKGSGKGKGGSQPKQRRRSRTPVATRRRKR